MSQVLRIIRTATLALTAGSLAACSMAQQLPIGREPDQATPIALPATANGSALPSAATGSLSQSNTPIDVSDNTVSATSPQSPQAVRARPTFASESQLASDTVRAPVSAAAENVPELAPAIHTVVAGDTLIRIAERYGVSLSTLLAANDLPNPDLLEVGQVINLPEVPVAYSSSFRTLPDSRLISSVGAETFNVSEFILSQAGTLQRMSVSLSRRLPDGTVQNDRLSASQVVERVSLEYSVDPRILLAFLEHFAGLLSRSDVDTDAQLYPLLRLDQQGNVDRSGLYSQLSWLADTLNRGYYGWKYRGATILDFPDGTRLFYDRALNAGSIALQYALAQLHGFGKWEADISETGIHATYLRLFGDPFVDAFTTVPMDLTQPDLALPFARGEVWRFTGGFHGGWGNGSAWAAIDFSPPAEDAPTGFCYVSSFPALAVADGIVARMGEGLVVLDLDGDGNENSGWSILYLHIDAHDALREGQMVTGGNILGYPSCSGGVTTATHLHIARRYNGEWIPADCNRCRLDQATPPFAMSGWRVVGMGSQLYQGFMVRDGDDRTAVAEQGRFADINEISW